MNSVLLIFLSSLFAAPTPILTSIPYFVDNGRHPIQAVAVDAAGNIYIAGTTTSPIPLVNALQSKLGGIFVAKFDPTGTKLIYSTYLYGDQPDQIDSAAGIAVDRDGNAYIAGTTRPATRPPLEPRRDGNAFVKKLNPTGSVLLYTRYIGGDTPASGIAVDTNGNAYIVGESIGADFPSVHPLPVQPSVKSLYVTNDSGRTWRAINNGLAMNAANVNSLAIDPTRPSTLYAATSGGLYKSTDAGANWTRLRAAAEIGINVVIDPRHPSTVYFTYKFGINMYLARSTDAGATWSNISDNFPVQSFPDPVSTIGAFAIDPGDSNVLWGIIIPNRFSTVIKSTDSGDHWQNVYQFPPDLLTFTTLVGKKLLIDPKNSSRLYACCLSVGGGVYRSDDGGKSWIRARRDRWLRGALGLFAAASDVRGTPCGGSRERFQPRHGTEPRASWRVSRGVLYRPGSDESGGDLRRARGRRGTHPRPPSSQSLKPGLLSPVSYARLAPGWIGLYQINFKVNENETPGRKQLLFSIGFGVSTNQSPIWVQ